MGETGRPPRRATAAWILYDLANTIFSFVVVSFYFAPWITDDLGGRDSHFAVAFSASMLVVLLLSPVLGAVSDRTGRIPFLLVSTLVAVVATALLGSGVFLGFDREATLWAAIAFFALGNIGFQLGLVFYDALLPSVSTPATIGRIGGIGVGVGYLGSVVGLAIAALVLGADPNGEPLLFVLSALAFLVFALPAFVFIRERRSTVPGPPLAETLRGVWSTVRALPRTPRLGRFLAGRILYADTVNTLILVLGNYAVHEAGFVQEEIGYAVLLGLGIVFAVLSAPFWGLLVDRAGPKHTLDVVLWLWCFTLAITALHPLLGLDQAVFYMIGSLVGVCLAGTWSADRPLLVGLSRPERVGELFGLSAMAGRFAAVIGPLVWALTVDVLLRDHELARPVAVFNLLLFMLIALWVLRRLPDPSRPGPTFFARYLPWRRADGTATPRPPRWPLRFPAHAFYLAVTTVVYAFYVAAYGGRSENAPALFQTLFVYHIRDLFAAPHLTLLHFATGIWINWHIVQLVYVWVLMLLFGIWFEIREGTRRAILVFYATSITAGLVAGVLGHLLHATVEAAWIDRMWTQGWTGGSAGAFGLMGAVAARARRPWLVMAGFSFWELNVAYWWLKSFTPVFHVTAMIAGFLLARFVLKPRPAPAV